MSDEEKFQQFFRICEDIIASALAKSDPEPTVNGNNIAQDENLRYFFQICTEILSAVKSDPGDELLGEHSYRGGSDRFTITSDVKKHVERFNLIGRHIVFTFTEPPAQQIPIEWFKESMTALVDYIFASIPPENMVGMIFHTPNMQAAPSCVSFRRADQFHTDVLWNTVANILQSNTEIFSDGQFEIELTQIRMPVGRGKSFRAHGLPYAELCQRKRGIVAINNTDHLCLPRALVVAMSWVTKEQCYVPVSKDIGGIQGNRARDLAKNAGVNIPVSGAGIPELIEFQRHLSNFNIVVYIFGGRGEVLYEGARGKNLPALNLLYFKSHYNVIKSLPAAFSVSYFCEPCHKAYDGLGTHQCANTCPACLRAPACSPRVVHIDCNDCNRGFRGQVCFNNHVTSVCRKLRMCDKCLKLYNFAKHQHICGEVYCKLCGTYEKSGHQCYIRNDIKKIQNKNNKEKLNFFIYFDMETRQETTFGKDKLHEVNLCVAQQSCTRCINIDNINLLCSLCGNRQHVFKDNPVAQFVQYVLLPRTSFSTVTCIAHNGKSFDHQFILHYLTETLNIKPKLLMNGSKIFKMQIRQKISFIDSINYLPMPLSAMPKAMDLPPSLKKGYFPHLFNTIENQFYEGPLPAVQYYGVDNMSNEARDELLNWHSQQIRDNVIFRMQKEIVEYCISDVDILRRACDKFRTLFLQNCNVCPFTEAVTIASACHRVFRRNFLKPESIGIIPNRGYRLVENQSKIALQWLINEETTRNINIQHAGRGKEVVLGPGLKVDGYYAPNKLVFEFYGCFYHGHDLCYRTNRDTKVYNDSSSETMNIRFERTVEKSRRLTKLGYTVIEMWECEFRKEVKTNPDLKKYLENHPLIDQLPLQPRDALYGGRTGNISQYRRVEGQERIKYIDVCSLYPYICKYGKYPVGHPEVFVGDDCQQILGNNNNIDKVEGLIKCKVLPPDNLFHPVLPRKVHGKLMFALCRTCCDDLLKTDCTHTSEQRQFTGTWVADEVRRAVELGYRVIQVYEIWQYKMTQYNRDSQTGGLFVEYINSFLKLKQEASGYPLECVDEESRRKYIEEYKLKEGVQLDSDKIEKNPCKRSQAKLMLNAFWGKFAQSENMPRTTIVSSGEELYDLVANPAVTVNRVVPAGDTVAYVNWEYQDDAVQPLATVNVAVAAYTTAQARLHLHERLQLLGRRVLYYDTDSIVYSQLPGQDEPPTGRFLGNFTDELECYGAGSFITEFVCGGPKNYAYNVWCADSAEIKQVCKVKGFTLNYKNSQIINFDSLKSIILNDVEQPTVIKAENIRRTADHRVVTRTETKKFQVNFMKRRLVDNEISIPYGYKRCRIE